MDDFKIANRVYQLEASSLDGEINKMIDQVLDSLDIPFVSEETKLLLKLYLFSRQMSKNTTAGMKVYNLSMFSSNGTNKISDIDRPEKYKIKLLAAANFLLPYLSKKYDQSKHLVDVNLINRLRLDWLTLENTVMLAKSLKVINFLAFLRYGKYASLPERILGIVIGESDKDYYLNLATNQVQMDIIGRDLVWKSIAELLSAFIPYINTFKLKNSILKVLNPYYGEVKVEKSPKRYAQTCASCGKQPFNPYLIGCKHVFCYYCIHSSYLCDTSVGYSCPTCKFNTKDTSMVQRYKILSTINS